MENLRCVQRGSDEAYQVLMFFKVTVSDRRTLFDRGNGAGVQGKCDPTLVASTELDSGISGPQTSLVHEPSDRSPRTPE